MEGTTRSGASSMEEVSLEWSWELSRFTLSGGDGEGLPAEDTSQEKARVYRCVRHIWGSGDCLFWMECVISEGKKWGIRVRHYY